jgi:predicted nuclease of restriction endonuclease-like (RecB) superfamily
VESEAARNYYLSDAIAQNWSIRAIERQINSFYYERILSSKKDKAVLAEAKRVTEALTDSPEDFIKDPYVLEFSAFQQTNSF